MNMASKIFTFYPPKKERSLYLIPNSHLLPSSTLVPLSKAAKKRKFPGATNKNPAFGPVNANPMDSQVGGASGEAPMLGGYGNSLYGAYPYGESVEIKNEKKKPNYYSYDSIKKSFDPIG